METASHSPGSGSGSGPRPVRRGAYLLPSLFTVANVFCGYYALTEAFRGALSAETAAPHLDAAAKAIGLAVLFDGFDGRIARMTGTTSAFGREFDSLADVITFGVAPALLAFAWGVRWLDPLIPPGGPQIIEHMHRIGWFLCFLFLICGAARLARFNIQVDPMPANPGRPGRKYFVGLPIPAGAGLVAAVVHVDNGTPIAWWPAAAFWLAMIFGAALLMVSRWRYYSFKDIDFRRSRRFVTVVALAALIAAIWFYSEPVLLAIALIYVGSGVLPRAAGVLRRLRPDPTRSPGLGVRSSE